MSVECEQSVCMYMLEVVGKLTWRIVPENTRIHDGYWFSRELFLSPVGYINDLNWKKMKMKEKT